jgi:hypothetical protein
MKSMMMNKTIMEIKKIIPNFFSRELGASPIPEVVAPVDPKEPLEFRIRSLPPA